MYIISLEGITTFSIQIYKGVAISEYIKVVVIVMHS